MDRGPIVEYERIRPLDSVILCARDFSDIPIINEQIVRSRAMGGDKKGYNKSFVRSEFEEPSARPRPRNQRPIILVPMSAHSQVNNSNVETFLQEARWEQPVVDSSKKRFTIAHSHSVTTNTTYYEVIADEKLLKPEDWASVVAIFLMGKTWQIKNYKPNDPANLFSNVLGIYVGWDNEALPPEIANWRVMSVKINKARRHADGQVVAKIWHAIEDATARLKAKGKK